MEKKTFYFAIYNSTAPAGDLFEKIEAENAGEAVKKINEMYPDAFSIDQLKLW